jgi:hypothetical protein
MDSFKITDLKTGCVKIKIKEGKLASVYEWKDYLNNHKEEVLESLKQEGVFLETVFLDKQQNDHFLIYLMKYTDLEKAKDAFSKSNLNVDKYHAQFKQEAWGDRQELELLIDFINLDIS